MEGDPDFVPSGLSNLPQHLPGNCDLPRGERQDRFDPKFVRPTAWRIAHGRSKGGFDAAVRVQPFDATSGGTSQGAALRIDYFGDFHPSGPYRLERLVELSIREVATSRGMSRGALLVFLFEVDEDRAIRTDARRGERGVERKGWRIGSRTGVRHDDQQRQDKGDRRAQA